MLSLLPTRYFETEDWNGIPGQWWFGGGTDITPSYVVPEDMQHFHGTLRRVCDAHDPAFYPRFKKWCDDYFCIRHRGETRGLGGIFFDDLNDRPKDQLLDFARDALAAVAEAYVPIIVKHKDDAFTDKQREWQQIRRGRCVAERGGQEVWTAVCWVWAGEDILGEFISTLCIVNILIT